MHTHTVYLIHIFHTYIYYTYTYSYFIPCIYIYIPIVIMPDRLLLRRVNWMFFWNPNLKALPGDVALKPGGEVAANDGKTFTIFFRGVNEGW